MKRIMQTDNALKTIRKLGRPNALKGNVYNRIIMNHEIRLHRKLSNSLRMSTVK